MDTKDAILRVRLTEAELGAVQMAAKQAGVRMSDWVRDALAKAASKAARG